jgi:heme-degrading monooxygenase HmoA
VIARIWRGAVRAEDGDEYVAYLENTGVSGYASTPGNRGVWMLRRDEGDRTQFLMFTLWDSMDSVKGFAGDDPEVAVYYPEDDRFLVEREDIVRHYEVARHVAPESPS